MAQQGRSLYKTIFWNFINSFKTIRYKEKLVGKDSFGTEYYESQGTVRSSRWFVPVNDKFDQEVPVEWLAWLRHKRKDPPTKEEIQYNLEKMKQTLENAKKLEAPYMKKKEKVPLNRNPFPTYEEYSLDAGEKKCENK